MAAPAPSSWHLGRAGYFRLLVGPGEPRALAGYYVGEPPRAGQVAGLIFAVPGLSEPPAAGPVVVPSGSFGILAVSVAHAATRPRAASGAPAILDSATLAALLQGFRAVGEAVELFDIQKGLPAEVAAAAPPGRASALLEGFRDLVGRGVSASAPAPLGPLDEEDEGEDGKLDGCDVEGRACLPPGARPGAGAGSSRSRPRQAAPAAEGTDLLALVASGAPVWRC